MSQPDINTAPTPATDFANYKPKVWGKNKDFKKPFEVTVPSGEKALVRRLSMTDILRLGVVEELDFMSKALSAVEEKPKDGEAAKSDDETFMSNFGKVIAKSENFGKLERAVNLVVQAGVIAPKLHLPPRDEAARQDGLIYVDQDVEFSDKLYIFGEVFETEGLTTFREESANGVGDVPNSTDVQLPSE